MIDLLIFGIVNALEIVGINGSYNIKGLGNIMRWIGERIPWWLEKPLWGCHKCMSSIHGTLFFIIFIEGGFFEYLFYIPMVSALSHIIKKI